MSADRAKSLARIARVQAEMVKLAEWRLAAADRRIADLAEDRARLVTYLSEAPGLGVPMARAALRSMQGIDAQKAAAEQARDRDRERLDALRRRDKAVTARAAEAALEARRLEEKTELAAVVEAWLAARDGSQDA